MGQVDNVVRPLLLSGKARMNTLVLLISLLGGVSAFGFIGIVLGPLVAALLTAILESSHACWRLPRVAPPPGEPSAGDRTPASPGPPARTVDHEELTRRSAGQRDVKPGA